MTLALHQICGNLTEKLPFGHSLQVEVEGELIDYGSPEYVEIQTKQVEEYETFDNLQSYGTVVRVIRFA